jgi:hypothetical protein
MSIEPFDRRAFLTLALALVVAPTRLLAAEATVRRGPYAVDIGLLYSMLTFRLEGSFEEHVDRAAGRYTVHSAGQGDRIRSRVESRGMLREGRWVPERATSDFEIYGRPSHTEVTFDHQRRTVEYHARGETFLMGRLRVVDDVLTIPSGLHVDDAISGLLNYRDGHWTPDAQGRLRTHVVRRRHSDDEGPDDVARSYRAELAPLDLTLMPDSEPRQPAALLDLSRFSSWARSSKPARIVFDEERRPTLITGPMILGSSVSIRLG